MARAPKYTIKRSWGWMTNIVVRKPSTNRAPKPAFAILRGLGRPSLLAASALGTVLLVTPAVVKKAHAQAAEPINTMPYTNTATDSDGTTYTVLDGEDCNSLSATCIDIEVAPTVDNSFISLEFDDNASSQLNSTEDGIVIETFSDNIDVTIENESSSSFIDVDGFGIAVVGGEDGSNNVGFLGDVNITWAGDITAGNIGVLVHEVGSFVDGNVGSVTIDVYNVTTNDLGGDAIHVGNVWGGPVDIYASGDLNTDADYARGVLVHDVAGDVYIEVVGSINTDGKDADGVQVGNVYSTGDSNGNVTVDVGDITTSGDYADGVQVSNVAGFVDITTGDITTGNLNSANYSDGVYVYDVGGDVIVSTGNISTNGDYSDGIDIGNVAGSVDVTTGDITTGAGDALHVDANGINIFDIAQGVTVTTGNITTFGDSSDGIDIDDIGGNVSATVMGDIATTGEDADGVDIDGVVGSVDVTVNGNISTSGDNANGIIVDYVGAEASASVIDIDVNGDITTNGEDADGIEVTEFDGDQVDITVTGNITTSDLNSHGVFVHEIYADSPSDGILINVHDIFTDGADSDGVNITGNIAADMTVNVSGDILVTGDNSAGVRVGLDFEDLDNESDIDAGNVYAAFGQVYGDVIVNVDEGASIYSESDGLILNNGAIVVSTVGDITVNNSGNLGASNGFTATLFALREIDEGNIALNDLGDKGDIVFNNEETGVFNGAMFAASVPYDYGNTYSPAGTVEINNDGLWDAEGPSFLVGKDVTLNNSGILAVTGEYNQYVVIEALALDGKDAEFYNTGIVTLSDDDPTDALALVGKDDDSDDFDWRGGPGSTLVLDAYLAGPDDSEADYLYIDGDTGGRTEIVINDVEPSSPGAYNPEGIPIIGVTGETDLGDFVLANGPINKGLFQYDLYLTDDGYDYEWVLASIPGQAAHEAPSLITGLEDLGHEAMAVGVDRLGVLGDCSASYRPGVNPTSDAPGCDDMGGSVWMSLLGRGMSVDGDSSFGLYGQSTDFDVSYDQVMWGLIAGADGGKSWTNGNGSLSSVFAGVLGGYLSTTMDFDSGNEGSYDGGMAGIYGGVQSGAWFMNSVLTGMFGTLSFGSSSLDPWDGADDSGVLQIGGTVDTGYRFGAERGMAGIYFEPGVTLSILSSSIDDAEWAGNEMSFDDSTSMRGRVGAKVGMETEGGFTAFVEAALWNEFGDDPSISISSLNAPDVSVSGDGAGMWADIGLGLGFVSEHFAVGAKGDVAYGEDMMGYGGSVKFQVSW